MELAKFAFSGDNSPFYIRQLNLSVKMSVALLYTDFFQSIYKYREYIKQSVGRDLKRKYKRSSLGYLWSMLSPLMMMIILATVFSSIMRSHVENYAVFLFVGMLTWAFFDGTCNSSLGIINANAPIIDKICFPKFIFLFSLAIYNLLNFFLSLVPLLVVMWFTGHQIPLTAFLMPIVLLPLFLFTIGAASLLAVANVFFEDTQHLTGVLFRGLYFLSPILYGREMLPPWVVKWALLNPMFSIIEQMRDLLYYGNLPPLGTYLAVLAASIGFLGLGLWVFKRVEHKFIYFL